MVQAMKHRLANQTETQTINPQKKRSTIIQMKDSTKPPPRPVQTVHTKLGHGMEPTDTSQERDVQCMEN